MASTGAATPESTVDALLRAVVARDADAIADSYARRDDLLVFVEGPRWQTQGHEAVARGWRDFCAAPARVTQARLVDGPHAVGSSDMASVAGTVHLVVDQPAGRVELDMRLTWVLQRDADGQWRVVHEHASQPLPDPYGTGDWLRTGAT
jgi:ketosteroid isomerase-like protein